MDPAKTTNQRRVVNGSTRAPGSTFSGFPGAGGFGFFSPYLENLGKYHFFRQLWLVLGVKLMEINSNWFSQVDYLPTFFGENGHITYGEMALKVSIPMPWFSLALFSCFLSALKGT